MQRGRPEKLGNGFFPLPDDRLAAT